MSLKVDTSRALRTHGELHKLVRAVECAAAEDESEWIEWKSTLDLSAKSTRALLARHIIGMANRRVREAGRFADGFGYVLIGIDPGNRCGINPVDLADLQAGIASYLGPHGPRWTASYDTEGGPPVLIVAVDPPRFGDPIHTLQRDFESYRAGDIFVRKLASTERANPADVDYLVRRRSPRFTRRRILAGAAGIAVTTGLSAGVWKAAQISGSRGNPDSGRSGPGQPGRGSVVWSSSVTGVATSVPVTVDDDVFISALYEGKNGYLHALRSRDGSQMWGMEVKGSGSLSSPVTFGRTVCVGTDNGVAYALRTVDGTKIWDYSAHAGASVVPVAGGGLVFISDGSDLAALRTADGRRVWSFPGGVPALSTGVVYVGGRDGRIYALRMSDGKPIWKSELVGTAAIRAVADGRLHIITSNAAGNGNNHVRALRSSDGRLLWSFSANGDDVTGLSLDGTTILIGTGAFNSDGPDRATHGCLYALRADNGNQQWRFPASGEIYGIVASAGSAYAACANGHIFGINVQDGSRAWSFSSGREWPTGLAVTNGTVYFGTGNSSAQYGNGVSVSTPGGHVYALRAGNGEVAWACPIDSFTGQPATSGGVIYVWSYDGKLYAIRA